MKRVVLYTNSSSVNDATRHYIDTINKAASDLGYTFYFSESIKNIKFKTKNSYKFFSFQIFRISFAIGSALTEPPPGVF